MEIKISEFLEAQKVIELFQPQVILSRDLKGEVENNKAIFRSVMIVKRKVAMARYLKEHPPIGQPKEESKVEICLTI